MHARAKHIAIVAAAISATLAACATSPGEAVGETLDARTGTTVTRLARPVELVGEETNGASGDPFAFFAPFQTNRMGSYALYLWVAVPAPNDLDVGTPAITCDGKPMTLAPVQDSLGAMGLSSAPYSPPAPWSKISYYVLIPEDLDCLRHASQARLTSVSGDQPERHFLGTREALEALPGFAQDSGATQAH